MALPCSGAISLNEMHIEAGGTTGTNCTINDADIRGLIGKGSGVTMSFSEWYCASAALPVPAGIILPYLSSGAAPSGWTLFTAANTYHIRGAQSGTIAIGATTTGSVSATVSLSSAGAHTGTTKTFANGALPAFSAVTGVSAGAHTHTDTGTGTCSISYKDFQLIKCSAETDEIPANACLLSATDLSGALTQYESGTNRYLRANSSYAGTGGSMTVSLSYGTVTSAGAHHHGNVVYMQSVYDPKVPFASEEYHTTNQGAHTNHAGSVSGTVAPKYCILTAWGNAAAAFPLEEYGIAMYESFTPPSGWVLCDGTSGTPDLRQNFVYFGTTANHGTTGGNNQVASMSGTSNQGGGHSHGKGTTLNSPVATVYHDNIVNHTHPASASSVSAVSKSYALAFIMRAP